MIATINDLPLELQIKILCLLPLRDIYAVIQIKCLTSATHHSVLWRQLAERYQFNTRIEKSSTPNMLYSQFNFINDYLALPPETRSLYLAIMERNVVALNAMQITPAVLRRKVNGIRIDEWLRKQNDQTILNFFFDKLQRFYHVTYKSTGEFFGFDIMKLDVGRRNILNWLILLNQDVGQLKHILEWRVGKLSSENYQQLLSEAIEQNRFSVFARLLKESTCVVADKTTLVSILLRTAIRKDKLVFAQFLLSDEVLHPHERATILTQKDLGETLLFKAISVGAVSIVRELLLRGANIADTIQLENDETYPDNGKTPLHRASELGYVEVVQLLLSFNANTRAYDKNGMQPLHLAIEGSEYEVLVALHAHDHLSILQKTEAKVSTLSLATQPVAYSLFRRARIAQRKSQMMVYSFLLDKGTPVDNIEILKNILKHELDYVDDMLLQEANPCMQRITPTLLTNLIMGRPELLLKRDADNRSLIYYACNEKPTAAAMVKSMLSALKKIYHTDTQRAIAAIINATTAYGMSLLAFAAKNNYLDIVNELIQLGVQLSRLEDVAYNQDPLFNALFFGNTAIASAILCAQPKGKAVRIQDAFIMPFQKELRRRDTMPEYRLLYLLIVRAHPELMLPISNVMYYAAFRHALLSNDLFALRYLLHLDLDFDLLACAKTDSDLIAHLTCQAGLELTQLIRIHDPEFFTPVNPGVPVTSSQMSFYAPPPAKRSFEDDHHYPGKRPRPD